MHNMSDIQTQLQQLIDSGDEAATKEFILKHFAELPHDLQKKLAVDLFEEALEKFVEKKEALIAMKKEAVEMIDEIGSKDEH